MQRPCWRWCWYVVNFSAGPSTAATTGDASGCLPWASTFRFSIAFSLFVRFAFPVAFFSLFSFRFRFRFFFFHFTLLLPVRNHCRRRCPVSGVCPTPAGREGAILEPDPARRKHRHWYHHAADWEHGAYRREEVPGT